MPKKQVKKQVTKKKNVAKKVKQEKHKPAPYTEYREEKGKLVDKNGKKVWCYSCKTRQADCVGFSSKGPKGLCFKCLFDDNSVHAANYKGEERLREEFSGILEEAEKRRRASNTESAPIIPKGKSEKKKIKVKETRGRFTITRKSK